MKKIFTSILLTLSIMNLSACSNEINQLDKPMAGEPTAIISTTMGDIKIRLFPSLTPEITKNFIEHAKSGKYNNTIFHRVVKNFVIQGGDFENQNGTGGYSYRGPGTTLEDEITTKLSHIYGAVAMANRGKNTNGSQFYIVSNPKGVKQLDGGYTIFGQVYEGLEVVDTIQKVETDSSDKPVTPILIKQITISE